VSKLRFNEVIEPNDSGEERTDWELLKEIHENVLIRLMWLQQQYPEKSVHNNWNQQQSKLTYYVHAGLYMKH